MDMHYSAKGMAIETLSVLVRKLGCDDRCNEILCLLKDLGVLPAYFSEVRFLSCLSNQGSAPPV